MFRPALLGLVFLGGGLGSVLRYLLGVSVQRHALSAFPLGTLVVNLLGCLAVGFLGTLGLERAAFSPETRTFLLVGLLGGFTTFSSFAWETLALLSARQAALSLLYLTGSLAGGVGGAYLGRLLGRG